MSNLLRTLLYVPGNNPGMVRDAGIYGADCVMFDLEDSVAVTEKDSARFLVSEALSSIDYPVDIYVRINGLDTAYGLEDLEAIVRTGKSGIRLPKAETGDDVRAIDREITRIEKEAGLPEGSTKLLVSIESAKGVLNALDIASASPRLVGIAIGGEDYVTDLKTRRSPEGIELLFGRSMVLLAARAAGVAAIDTVYSDANNEEGLRAETSLIKQLGFDGKSVINPRQIGPVHEVFAPTQKEVDNALDVMEAIAEANRRGSGVIALKGKMIDKPIVMRAERTLQLAEAVGMIKKGDVAR